MLYPKSGIPNGKPYHRLFFNDIHDGLANDQLWAQFHEEASLTKCKTVLLSDEAWSAPWISRKEICIFKEKVHPFKATILIVLRNPTDYFISRYRHAIRMRTDNSGRSFKQFLAESLSEKNEYLEQLNLWGDVFGRENIRVLIYDMAKKDNLLGMNFLQMLGLSLSKVKLPVSNITYPDETLKALRLIVRLEQGMPDVFSKTRTAKAFFNSLRDAVCGAESARRLLIKRTLNLADRSRLVPESEKNKLQNIVAHWTEELVESGWLTDVQARYLSKEL